MSLRLPRRAIAVIAGPSGSGKTSLLIDTIAAEGLRRAAALRQLTGANSVCSARPRPLVDEISGLGPVRVIALQPPAGSRDTVASLLDLGELLFELCQSVGIRPCPECDIHRERHDSAVIGRLSRSRIQSEIFRRFSGHLLAITACLDSAKKPPTRKRSSPAEKTFSLQHLQGFLHLIVAGTLRELESLDAADFTEKPGQQIEVVIDRLDIEQANAGRLEEAITHALRLRPWAIGVRNILPGDTASLGPLSLFPLKDACGRCGYLSFELARSLFDLRTAENNCSKKEIEFAGLNGLNQQHESEFFQIQLGTLRLGRILQAPAEVLITELSTPDPAAIIASSGLSALRALLDELCKLDLGYLTLSRPLDSLSSGELTKLLIFKGVHTAPRGATIIMDEPGGDLHRIDLTKIFHLLRAHKQTGGSVILAGNNPLLWKLADYLVCLGPGSGKRGGQVIAAGNPADILDSMATVSTGNREPADKPQPASSCLQIKCASLNNLKRLGAKLPLNQLVCVTGPAGAGKTSLVSGAILPLLELAMHGRPRLQSAQSSIGNLTIKGNIEKVVALAARNSRSSPSSLLVTFSGLFEPIRNVFAGLEVSRMRGYTKNIFSLAAAGSGKSKSGLCQHCRGSGVDTNSAGQPPARRPACPACAGTRFKQDILEVKFKNLSIAQILGLSVQESLPIVGNLPGCRQVIESLLRFRLGHLVLGQPLAELSSAEVQRLTLAVEMKDEHRKAVFLLDSPCTGLYQGEIQELVQVFRETIAKGNSIIAIEHHPLFVSQCDYVMEIGPGGGPNGGTVGTI